MKRHQRRLELGPERNPSETELSLALSPVLTCGYFSESLSQSVSARVPRQRQANGSSRCSTPPPRLPLAPRDEGVVIQAGMTFVLGQRKTARSASAHSFPVPGGGQNRSVRQHFRPMAAHTMPDTTSAALTRSIKDFLGRTDHVMNEWKQLGRDGPAGRSLQRSRTSMRSLPFHSSGRLSLRSLSVCSSERNGFRSQRAPSYQSISEDKSSADTDFGSCQDLNDYDEVKALLVCREFAALKC